MQTIKLNNLEKEQFFGDLIQCIAFELRILHTADVALEENENHLTLRLYFYEKAFWKKNVNNTVIITVTKQGEMTFATHKHNTSHFRKDAPLRFLKCQVAQALDGYFDTETHYTQAVLKQYARYESRLMLT